MVVVMFGLKYIDNGYNTTQMLNSYSAEELVLFTLQIGRWQ